MHVSQSSSAYELRASQGCGVAPTQDTKSVKPTRACDKGRGTECMAPPSQEGSVSKAPRNPLVAAMMEAIKGLVPAGATARATDVVATTDVEVVAASAPSTKENAKALKEAAFAFANELFQALKSVDGDSGAKASKSHGYGARSGYGGIAQGLERLAQQIAPATTSPVASEKTPVSARAPVVETTPYTPTPAAAESVTASAVPEAVKMSAPTPVAASASSAAPITINISISIGASTAAEGGGDAQGTESPLLAAFKKLMLALNPKTSDSSATATDATEAKSPAQMLQAFLQQIAKSLQGDSAAQTTVPAQGGLINLTA